MPDLRQPPHNPAISVCRREFLVKIQLGQGQAAELLRDPHVRTATVSAQPVDEPEQRRCVVETEIQRHRGPGPRTGPFAGRQAEVRQIRTVKNPVREGSQSNARTFVAGPQGLGVAAEALHFGQLQGGTVLEADAQEEHRLAGSFAGAQFFGEMVDEPARTGNLKGRAAQSQPGVASFDLAGSSLRVVRQPLNFGKASGQPRPVERRATAQRERRLAVRPAPRVSALEKAGEHQVVAEVARSEEVVADVNSHGAAALREETVVQLFLTSVSRCGCEFLTL